MLNELLTEMVELGMVVGLSEEPRKRLIKKVLSVCHTYDCNWGEIIDVPLAGHLGVCRYCEELATELDGEGYCCRHKPSAIG